jgi:hypothetical protein
LKKQFRVNFPKQTSDRGFLVLLLIYHLAFSFLFTWYLGENRGDAIAYWNLRAEEVSHPERWFSHWGTRSYFIQWLNFIPSHMLGLPLWFGNVWYSLASFAGMVLLFDLVKKTLNESQKSNFLLYFIFLMPNLHFWTSAVGKESLSFLGLVLFLKGIGSIKPQWIFLGAGVTLSYMVRPLQGMILAIFSFGYVIFIPSLSKKKKAVLLVLGGVVMVLMFRFILYITHIPTLNLARIMEFSQSQMEFLDRYGAKSAVPMGTYSWPMKFWTLFFRPFIGEWKGVWYLGSIIENTFSLIILAGTGLMFLKRGVKDIPLFVWTGILFGCMLMGVYALTLNNLGIIMRMKSFFMIFFHLPLVYLIGNKYSKRNPSTD